MELKIIAEKEARAFIHKWQNNDTLEHSHDVWYGVYDGEELVYVAAINDRGGWILLGGTLTRPDYRNRGISKHVYKYLVDTYGDRKMRIWATPTNAHICEKYFGFETRKTYPNGVQYMTRKPNKKT